MSRNVKHWYALHTKPRKELLVARLLDEQRVEPFVPLAADARAPRREPAPFFPGYLFARLNLQQHGLGALQWLPGVRGVVQADGEPVPVADEVIEHIRERLEDIALAGGLGAASFRNGDRVVIVGGPFAGYDGMFDAHLSGPRRVRILLRLITDHRDLPLELDAADLKRLDA